MSAGAEAARASPLNTGPASPAPLADHLGLLCEQAADGEAVVSAVLRPDLPDAAGGGSPALVMALLGSAMAQAARSRAGPGREVLMVDMHISVLRPCSGRLVATGRVSGGGRKVCFCEAGIVDGTGQRTAQAMGTFRQVDAQPIAPA